MARRVAPLKMMILHLAALASFLATLFALARFTVKRSIEEVDRALTVSRSSENPQRTRRLESLLDGAIGEFKKRLSAREHSASAERPATIQR